MENVFIVAIHIDYNDLKREITYTLQTALEVFKSRARRGNYATDPSSIDIVNTQLTQAPNNAYYLLITYRVIK